MAVSIQLQSSLVNVNFDSHFHPTSHPDGILQLSLDSLQFESKHYKGGEYSGRRAAEYDNYFDFNYAGKGYAYGGDVTYEKVFRAFGFPANMPAHDKILTILETLNNQL